MEQRREIAALAHFIGAQQQMMTAMQLIGDGDDAGGLHGAAGPLAGHVDGGIAEHGHR